MYKVVKDLDALTPFQLRTIKKSHNHMTKILEKLKKLFQSNYLKIF